MSEKDNKITLSEIVRLIYNTNGEEFDVEFFKRNSKQKRKMKCKINDNTDGMPYDPITKQLISVYDVKEEAHKCINITGIISAKINKQVYKVK